MGRECNGIFIESTLIWNQINYVGHHGVRASACGAPSTSSTAKTLITTIDPPKNNKSLPIVLHTTYTDSKVRLIRSAISWLILAHTW